MALKGAVEHDGRLQATAAVRVLVQPIRAMYGTTVGCFVTGCSFRATRYQCVLSPHVAVEQDVPRTRYLLQGYEAMAFVAPRVNTRVNSLLRV